MRNPAAIPFYPIAPGAPLPPGGAEEVGNKAWNLMRMAAEHLTVPAGFVLPTSWCRRFRSGEDGGLGQAIEKGMEWLESASGLGFGSVRRPLLVSVRSGAAVSMPGMMETVLDVGLNRETTEGLIRLTGNPRLAWDCYRRLVEGYAEVVCQLARQPFDQLLEKALASAEAETARQLDFRSLRQLVGEMISQFADLAGTPFPQNPRDQLKRAVLAILRSWDSPKAVAYRKLNQIDDEAGTAVTVQTMVFGNAGGGSGSGVAFTRSPVTGDPELYLDFQFNAQGEDVVAGRQVLEDQDKLRTRLPETWAQLQSTGKALESIFRDVQDFEFTLQNGTLYLLQSRSAKRTQWAALRIVVDLVEEGLLQPAEALSLLAGIDLASVARTRLASPGSQRLAQAKIGGIGVAAGAIALDAEAAERMTKAGHSAILVRRETSTADIAGIAAAQGILTASGGRTSHAAVVARQLGKVCLVGCTDLQIDPDRRTCTIGGRSLNEGDSISLDGNDGSIYAGALAVIEERPERELAKIASWGRGAKEKKKASSGRRLHSVKAVGVSGT